MKRRHLGLALALGGTVLAAYLAPTAAPGGAVAVVDAVAAGQRGGAAPAKEPGAAPRASLRSGLATIKPRDGWETTPPRTFSAAPWAAGVSAAPARAASAPAAAAMPEQALPPPPMPPALPFRVVGRYLNDDRAAVFVQLNDQNLVVRSGDLIADQYRVEAVDEASLTVLHLPTRQRQTLGLGATK